MFVKNPKDKNERYWTRDICIGGKNSVEVNQLIGNKHSSIIIETDITDGREKDDLVIAEAMRKLFTK